jgi:hypothetical protein
MMTSLEPGGNRVAFFFQRIGNEGPLPIGYVPRQPTEQSLDIKLHPALVDLPQDPMREYTEPFHPVFKGCLCLYNNLRVHGRNTMSILKRNLEFFGMSKCSTQPVQCQGMSLYAPEQQLGCTASDTGTLQSNAITELANLQHGQERKSILIKLMSQVRDMPEGPKPKRYRVLPRIESRLYLFQRQKHELRGL